MKALLLVVAAALTLTAPAEATASTYIAQPPLVHVITEPCPHQYDFQVDGCAFPDGRAYVGHSPDPTTVEHELGHVFDEQVLTDGHRRVFARMLGFAPHVPWKHVAEQFADAYMACRLNMTPDDPGVYVWQMMSRYDPGPRRHQRVCAALGRVTRQMLS